MRSDYLSARVLLALPDVETHWTLAARTSVPVTQARIRLWLVSDEGVVTVVSTNADGGGS